MTTSQINQRIYSKWLSTRATIWSFIFGITFKTGIVKNVINSQQLTFNWNDSASETLWIVTSVIHTKKKPFSYAKQRSVFTDDLRFTQTKETISSIRLKTDQATINLVEGSNYESIHHLESNEVQVSQVRSRLLKFIINGPYKGLGEAILLLLLQIEDEPTKYIRKISGRYVVDEILERRPILFREQNGSAISISYGMTVAVFQQWQMFLQRNLLQLSRGKSMEQVLLEFARENSFSSSPHLGVSGKVAVTGGIINV